MRRILFVQPSLQPPGGGNGVAAWMMEALKHEHRLTLLTWDSPNLPEVNRFFGTTLRSSEFDLQLMPRAIRMLAPRTPTPMSLLKSNYLLRRCHRLAPDYDLVMTANNESDLGTRGIQYVHFPKFELVRPPVDLCWYHRLPLLLSVYYRFASRVTGFSYERMRQNLTLVNSDFIGCHLRALHGIAPVTLYPPAVGSFPDVPWERRKNGFVCIGRISTEKRIERIIEILARVREAQAPVHLHVVGTPDDDAYTAFIRQLIRANSSWVFLHEKLSRAELVKVISSHRYGIHGMEKEHFGMSVAELLSGGCIPFVPNGGGQVEIVGRDERLLYASVDEAAEKILRTIRDPDRQASLRSLLASRKELFSTDCFVRRIREFVRNFDSAGP